MTKWCATRRGIVRTAVQAESPVDLGGLKGSVNTVIMSDVGGVPKLRVIITARYALPVIKGHGEIRPRNPGGVLTWLDRLTGERVFARKVRAVAANPFVTRGLSNVGLRVRGR